MSKSVGNVVDPVEMVKKYGSDAFRYYLMRDIPFGQDGDFSEKRMVERINNELVNELGNLSSRTLSLVEKFKGELKGKGVLTLDFKALDKKMQALELHHVLDDVFSYIKKVNKYIHEHTPWEKKDKELGDILYNLVEALRFISILIYPFMPTTSLELCNQLGVSLGNFNDLSFKAWKGNIKKGKHLFSRI